jgi:DNA-binding response OmpR family regulator
MTAAVPQILVVEDDAGLQKLVKTALEGAGYKVHQAYDGQEGLQAALELIPDLILLDIMMPKLDGRDVLVRLKKESTTSAIPVVILSARTMELDRRVGLELGADDYMEKPFTISKLLKHVKARLWRAQEQS